MRSTRRSGSTTLALRPALLLTFLASASFTAGCASTPCAGTGFASSVNIDFAALHRQHPGFLTVHLCVDGACSSSQLSTADDSWTADAEPTERQRHITVEIADITGAQIFSGSVDSDPTKVMFDPGQCDGQTGRNSAVTAGQDGKLTSVPVTPIVISPDPAAK